MNSNEYLYIVALGGISFDVHVIEDFDPSHTPAGQDGRYLGRTDFGDLDADGQYVQTDDEIIEHVRQECNIAESIPAGVW